MKVYWKKNQGFSLIELLTVVGIIVIMVGIASFSFFRYAENSRVSGAANNISSIIRGARQASITNRETRRVVLELHPQGASDTELRDKIWVEKPPPNRNEDLPWIPVSDVESFDYQSDVTDVVGTLDGHPVTNENVDANDLDSFRSGDNFAKICYEFNSQGQIVSRYILSGNNAKTEFNEGGYLIHVINRDERIALSYTDEGNMDSFVVYDPNTTKIRFLKRDVVNNIDPYTERRKCYTIVVLHNVGRTRVLDYGYGSPWDDTDPKFPEEL